MTTTKSTHNHLASLGKTYLTCFFLFGQSSVNPRANFIATLATDSIGNNKRLYLRAREVMPSLCFGILSSITGYFSFHKFSFVSITFDLTVYCVFISCALSTCFLVLLRTPILGHRSQYLWTKFTQYERFVSHRLQFKMTYDRFRKRYNRRIVVSLAVFSLVFTTRIMFTTRTMFTTSDSGIQRHTSALILVFLTKLTDFQILFYISLLGYMLENVNRHIVDLFCVIDCAERNHMITATFKDYKVMYYKLWEISQSINDYFGWILVSLVMRNANATVQSIYWIIVDLHEEDVFAYPPILSK